MRLVAPTVALAAVTVAVLGSPHSLHPVSDHVRTATSSAPSVVVLAGTDRGRASRRLLGVNHHWNRNGYDLWDPRADAPYPVVVAESRRAGLQSVRYPGGTTANLFDWKREIGDVRECQVDARGSDATGFAALRHGLRFGPDEYMRYLHDIGAAPLIMMPFVNETPADAADWVEYMNSRAHAAGNPDGGVDWADVRARNGHPRPYHVTRWEIGNEQNHPGSRYWLSPTTSRAVRQYAFGGSRVRRDEALGKNCAHPLGGVRSNGAVRQVFEALYPPVRASTFRLAVDGTAWRRVRNLGSSGPSQRVFRLHASTGRVVFGDGVHGTVPPSGAKVIATYTSVHAGFFTFAHRMKAVDRHIRVCSGWGNSEFVRLVRGRRYDCLTTHAITSFAKSSGEHADWSTRLQGHDSLMQATARRRAQVAGLQRMLPPGTPLWITEATSIGGDRTTFPSYATSASHAVYMASLWADWMNLGIRWGMGDDLLSGTDRTVLGPAPDYAFTADAVTRQALTPMFSTGGRVVTSTVDRDPIRRPRTGRTGYAGLVVAATRTRHAVSVLVVNRLPTRSVTARIRLDDFRSAGSARVRSVSGDSFWSWNRPGTKPAVRLTTRTRSIGARGFSYTFPATSTTVFRIPSA